jgi:hypothetical protein
MAHHSDSFGDGIFALFALVGFVLLFIRSAFTATTRQSSPQQKPARYVGRFLIVEDASDPDCVDAPESQRWTQVHRRQTDPVPHEPLDEETQAWEAKWKKCLYANVRGVTFDSESGVSRQDIARKCSAGEELLLVREPNNGTDPNAIIVVRQGGVEDLGYLPQQMARILAPQMDRGAQAAARIIKVTGIKPAKPTVGVNIVIGQNYAPRKKSAKRASDGADIYGS